MPADLTHQGARDTARIAISWAQATIPVRSPKLAGMLELGSSFAGAYLLRRGLFMPWERDRVMGPDFARAGLDRLRPLELIGAALEPEPGSDFARVAALETTISMRNQLLRDTDWASMAHSIEVRVPLVDTVLLATIARVVKVPAKGALAAAPAQPVPAAITSRAKTGFSTPVARWLDDTIGGRGTAQSRVDRPTTGSNSRAWAMKVAALWQSDARVSPLPLLENKRAHV